VGCIHTNHLRRGLYSHESSQAWAVFTRIISGVGCIQVNQGYACVVACVPVADDGFFLKTRDALVS